MVKKSDYQEYWDQNIEHWGKMYGEDFRGQEALRVPGVMSLLYNKTIAKYEARLMQDRYARTMRFLDTYVSPGTIVSDIGCGTGLFTVAALQMGAEVHAIDFSDNALKITEETVKRFMPNGKVKFHNLNVQTDNLPRSDIALCVGVTPYIADLSTFLNNILSSSDMLFCHYCDPDHWANKLRAFAPNLNVRNIIFHSKDKVDAVYSEHNWLLKERISFATGYIDLASTAR